MKDPGVQMSKSIRKLFEKRTVPTLLWSDYGYRGARTTWWQVWGLHKWCRSGSVCCPVGTGSDLGMMIQTFRKSGVSLKGENRTEVENWSNDWTTTPRTTFSLVLMSRRQTREWKPNLCNCHHNVHWKAIGMFREQVKTWFHGMYVLITMIKKKSYCYGR